MKKNKLGTKYLKILTTKAQREIIQTAIKDIMYRYDVKEGRATELMAADYLAGIDHPITDKEEFKIEFGKKGIDADELIKRLEE